MKTHLFTLTALFCGLMSTQAPARAQFSGELSTIFASDGAQGHEFGGAVAIDGTTAIVGAIQATTNGVSTGGAYIYEVDVLGNWSETDRLSAGDGAWADGFGISVSISGDYAIVGAQGVDDHGSNSGAAYIYERDLSGNWNLVDKLTAFDAAAGDVFGWSVGISGSRAIVGAMWDDDNGNTSGSAYIFERSGAGSWMHATKLTGQAGSASHQFGRSAAISGDYAVVGAWNAGDNGSQSGAVYFFERANSGLWLPAGRKTAGDGAVGDQFGVPVAISGDYAVVGAHRNDDGAIDAGSAYVFERSAAGQWIQSDKLTAPTPNVGDQFGRAAAISGDHLVVGSWSDDDLGYNSGSAYVFGRGDSGGWTLEDKLLAGDGQTGDQFGTSVAITDELALIGARFHQSKGAAYLFGCPDALAAISDLKTQISDLVTSMALSFGQATALTTNLDSAIHQLTKNNPSAQKARKHLQDFINKVNLDINNGEISTSDGQALIDAALLIMQCMDEGAGKGGEMTAQSFEQIPVAFALDPAYPNPFNPQTSIQFALPEATHVTLRVFDAMGREVETLVNSTLGAGHHEATFRAGKLPSGLYLYSLDAGGQILFGKMLLIK